MALLEWKCQRCGREQLAFDTDRQTTLPSHLEGCQHDWKPLQPLATVIHSTELFFRSMLDSILSAKAVCDKVTRDAKGQYELKQYLEMKKNL